MRGPWVSLWGALLLLLLLLGTTDGYLHSQINSCDFNSTSLKDIRFMSSFFYNKLMYLRFDSDVGWFVGYTKFGVERADQWNHNTTLMKAMRAMKNKKCVNNTKILSRRILSKSVEPTALITTAPSPGSLKVLVCSVYGFFPKNISVTWTNHQQKITTGVTSTDLLPDSDWYYQLHSHLEYYPRSGDQISCVIKHSSLKEPMVLYYGGALSGMDLELVLIGVAALVLGLVLSLTGFFCYMCPKWKQERTPLS